MLNVEHRERTGIGAWKESTALFLHHMAPESGPSSRLILSKGSKNDNEIVLFVDALRVEHTMDRSVVYDVAVCPLEMSWAREVVAWIMRKEPLQRCKILVTIEERVFWKRILPALVEKALTDWTHRPDCECVRTSRIPLCDNGNGEKIICSCGLGQLLDERGSWRTSRPVVSPTCRSIFTGRHSNDLLSEQRDVVARRVHYSPLTDACNVSTGFDDTTYVTVAVNCHPTLLFNLGDSRLHNLVIAISFEMHLHYNNVRSLRPGCCWSLNMLTTKSFRVKIVSQRGQASHSTVEEMSRADK